MAYKPQVGPTMSAPNVIPMADIMLVLLIIFMVVTPMLSRGHDVNLARVDNPADMPNADRDDAIIVAVARDGKIFVGTTETPEDQLTAVVRERVNDRTDKSIFIKSDGRAKYGDVTKVVDDVRSAGVDQVGLLTERVERQATATPTAPPPDAH
jgi:biopolymer transport protein ExbD/biopolymer transport protein TolR